MYNFTTTRFYCGASSAVAKVRDSSGKETRMELLALAGI